MVCVKYAIITRLPLMYAKLSSEKKSVNIHVITTYCNAAYIVSCLLLNRDTRAVISR